jgi:hypothetical protein
MKAFKQHLNKKGQPKIAYSSLEQAVEAANSETFRVKGFRMVPYLCNYCQKYHIGKPDYQKQ